MKLAATLAAILLFSSSAPLLAAPPDELIRPIQQRWAEIKYRHAEKQQADLYQTLARQAAALSEAHPNLAEALVWEGIVVSSEAGARGGLGALSLAKKARRLLEESLKLDEKALDGSAYASLATLYAKVPGWPIGFGDAKRAETYFRKALAIQPAGIDANYFYAEFLADNERFDEARAHLAVALKAPARAGRELADQGRRQEITALLNRIDKGAR